MLPVRITLARAKVQNYKWISGLDGTLLSLGWAHAGGVPNKNTMAPYHPQTRGTRKACSLRRVRKRCPGNAQNLKVRCEGIEVV